MTKPSGELETPTGNGELVNTASELTGVVAFNPALYAERQETINGILSREYHSHAAQVEDLNRYIATCDDDFGISYIYMTGRSLPGIAIHGVATALSFSANHAPGAQFQGANLDYAVFSGSSLPDLSARRASFNHAILPYTDLSGDFRGVSAIKAILSFADITGLDVRGADLRAAYLMATRGLTQEMLRSAADVSSAISSIPGASARSSRLQQLLGDALSHFTQASDADMAAALLQPRIFAGIVAANKMFNKNRRGQYKGIVLDGVTLSDSEVSTYDFEGGIWSDVDADRLDAIRTRMAGLVLLDSSLDDLTGSGLYAPGMVAIGCSLRRSELPENAAGAIFLNSDLSGASPAQMQPAGALVIGGKAPEIDDETRDRIRVVRPADLPPRIMDKIVEIGRTVVSIAPSQVPELNR